MERHHQYKKVIWIWTLLTCNAINAQGAVETISPVPLECQFESTWGHDSDVLPLSPLYHFYPDLKKQPTLIHGCDIGAAEQAGSLDQKVSTLGYQELTLEQVDGNGDYGGSFEAGNGYLNPITFPAMDWNVHSSWSLEAINGYIGFMRMQQYHYAWLLREAIRRIQTGLCQQATVKFNCAYEVWSNRYSKNDDYLTSEYYKDHLENAKMRYEEYRLPIALDPLVVLKTFPSPLTGVNGQRWELTVAGKKNLTSKQNLVGILERDIIEKANLQFNDDFKVRSASTDPKDQEYVNAVNMAHQVMLKLSKKYLYQGACVDQAFRVNAASAKPAQHPFEQRFRLTPGQLLAFPVSCGEKIILDKKSTMTTHCHQVIRDTWAEYLKQRKIFSKNN